MARNHFVGQQLKKFANTDVTLTTSEINELDGAPAIGDITATAAEINAACDVSGRLVAQAAGNFALTAATHGNRITLVNDADVAITLPAATGTGNIYKVVIVTTAWTGGSIKAASAADSFLGGIWGVDDDADAAYAWKAEANDDTISGNGTATGGKVGDWYKFTDVATGLFLVEGFITQSGGSEATPFSATVS
jgi:hypothetical protein